MNRPAIEAALKELNAQQSVEHGNARTKAIEEALDKLGEAAPPDINRTVGKIRHFVHAGDECSLIITISPTVFSVVVDWE